MKLYKLLTLKLFNSFCMPLGAEQRTLIGAAGGTSYIADALNFDGSTDYLRRTSDLTGQADGRLGILSFWLRMQGGDSTDMYIYEHISPFAFPIYRGSGGNNKVGISMQQDSGYVRYKSRTLTSITVSSGWCHILASWNTNTSTSNLYLNDADDEDTGYAVDTNEVLNYTHPTHTVGASSTQILKFNGDLFDFYYNTFEYLDITQEANRRKFISAAGKPVFLGDNGELPTGTSPILFLHLDDGETASNFAINAGTGGNFTVNGTPITATTSPTD